MRFKHLFRAATILLAAHVGGGDAGAQPGGSSGPTPPTVPATSVGINLGGISAFSTQRAFANLAQGTYWAEAGLTPHYINLPPAYQTPTGGISFLPAGAVGIRGLIAPDTGPHGVDIGCTWTGQGAMTAQGVMTNLSVSSNSMHFHWTNLWVPPYGVNLRVTAVDPAHPIDNIDCRETTTPATDVFDPAFVASLKGFKTIRFMDWQNTNNNATVTWATRNQPSTIAFGTADGVPVEDMLVLADAVGADPWFNMPWNADATYVQNFAQYVHDHLPAGRHVYVETGNEIWNTGFPAAKQAISEGLSEGLSTVPTLAGLYRYGEKTTQVMAVWSRKFADRPGTLIRVAGTQHVVPSRADAFLGYRNTAASVDVLATAPYFGGDLMYQGVTDNLDELYLRLGPLVDQDIALSVANQAIARKYGKGYVAYEAGQGIVIPYNVPLLAQIERDPRMYGIYQKFLSEWRGKVGGELTLFNNVGAIAQSGAWGLLEHSGQPLAAAPKMRAVLDDRAAN